MLSKPLSLILVYLLTVTNLTILLLPLLLILLPFTDIRSIQNIASSDIIANIKYATILLIFLVSFLMIIYLFLDFIWGFSCKTALRGAKRFDKIKGYEFLAEIFEQVKKKFGEKSVRLYIKNSKEINAFALGSFGRKSIILTSGLINHYLTHTQNQAEFLLSIRSILGHEMSHLVNKDFIPGLLIIINQKVTNFISRLLQIALTLMINFMSFIRMNNRLIISLIVAAHDFVYNLLTFFNRHIIYNLYEFLRRFISRGIEYRCDKQSARAFGGENMALSLALLGKSGYFTLFSTHPATLRRVKRVKNISVSASLIRPSIINAFFNYLAWMSLVVICLLCAKISKVDLMVRKYLVSNHEQIYYFLSSGALFLRKSIVSLNALLFS
jgi:Zn-dependent protease with chaperone function